MTRALLAQVRSLVWPTCSGPALTPPAKPAAEAAPTAAITATTGTAMIFFMISPLGGEGFPRCPSCSLELDRWRSPRCGIGRDRRIVKIGETTAERTTARPEGADRTLSEGGSVR